MLTFPSQIKVVTLITSAKFLSLGFKDYALDTCMCHNSTTIWYYSYKIPRPAQLSNMCLKETPIWSRAVIKKISTASRIVFILRAGKRGLVMQLKGKQNQIWFFKLGEWYSLFYNSVYLVCTSWEYTNEYSEYFIIKITKLIETTELIIVKICETNLLSKSNYKNQPNKN